MLFILYGGALEIGTMSKEYFQNHGFEVIEKRHYLSSNSKIKTWLEGKKYVKSNEVLDCDFHYEINGLNVGFNKEQIIDAAHGIKNCLLTMSVTSIDFIKQIKQAYGDYVTVIYSYVDFKTLSDMTKRQQGIDKVEIAQRLKTAEEIKRIYIYNSELFDEIVIYSEDNLFDQKSLEKQYDNIIKRRSKIEKALNNNRFVELPYVGNEKYIFISYSHKNKDEVYPILSQLQLSGYRIWYDEGISGGTNWAKIIANKIKDCEIILLFSSENAIQSDEVEAEINCGRKCKKKFITIRLDNNEFPLHHEMYISKDHSIMADDELFIKKLSDALPKFTCVNFT